MGLQKLLQNNQNAFGSVGIGILTHRRIGHGRLRRNQLRTQFIIYIWQNGSISNACQSAQKGTHWQTYIYIYEDCNHIRGRRLCNAIVVSCILCNFFYSFIYLVPLLESLCFSATCLRGGKEAPRSDCAMASVASACAQPWIHIGYSGLHPYVCRRSSHKNAFSKTLKEILRYNFPTYWTWTVDVICFVYICCFFSVLILLLVAKYFIRADACACRIWM